jgi:hypothetical protein
LVSFSPDQRWVSDWRRPLSRLALPESGSDRAVSLVLQDYKVFAAVPRVAQTECEERFPEPELHTVERNRTQSSDNPAFHSVGLATTSARLSPSPAALAAPIISPPLADDETTAIPSLWDPSPLVPGSAVALATCGITVLEPVRSRTASFVTAPASPSLLEVPTPFGPASDPGHLRTPLAMRHGATELETSRLAPGLAPFATGLTSPSLLEVPTPFGLTSNPGYLRTPLAIRHGATGLEASRPVAGFAPNGHHPLNVVPDLIDTMGALASKKRLSGESVIPDIPDSTPRRASAVPSNPSPVEIDARQVIDRIAFADRIPFARQLGVAFRLSCGDTAVPEAAATTGGIRAVPDSPAFLSFTNLYARRSPGDVLSLLSTLSPHETAFLATDMRPQFPSGAPLAEEPAFIKISTANRSRAALASSALRDIFDAPALAAFSAIALRPPSEPSLLSERQFAFNPLRSPWTRIRPVQLDVTRAVAPAARRPLPLDFRWQREQTTWDRGAHWKRPLSARIFPNLALDTVHPAAELRGPSASIGPIRPNQR